MWLTVQLFVLFCTFLSCSCQWVIDDEGCRTPKQGVGVCIPIKECQPMVEALKRQTQLTEEMKTTLRSYQCGVTSSSVKVCCPDGKIYLSREQESAGSSGSAPDVSSHRNFRLLPTQCGKMDTTQKIVNGDNATLFEFPWMALLSYKSSSGPKFKCGASIISERYILTAAHCLQGQANNLIGVRVGEFNIPTNKDCELLPDGKEQCAPPVQDLTIEDIIIHSGYNKSDTINDIGLLRVNKIKFAKNVQPICMPTGMMRNLNLDNTKAVVTGWGATETGHSSPYLLKVVLPIISLASCHKYYENSMYKQSTKQLCAFGGDKDSCNGDSGGPMQIVKYHNNDVRYVQIGLVSYGPKFCGAGRLPGVYTRIDYFLDWILNKMK